MPEQQHPITPPSELLEQWREDCPHFVSIKAVKWIGTKAAQWGADQELEACVEWLQTTAMTKPWKTVADLPSALRAAIRQPQSLKEQALEHLSRLENDLNNDGYRFDPSTIRSALKSLPE